MKLLSRSEEIVLLAIWKLQGDAYGVTIRQMIFETTGQKWSIGAIYAPLHRLENKGFVSSIKSEPIAERGGRSKIYYQVTSDGRKALAEIKRINEAIWMNVPVLGVENPAH
ncbi:PadR family transcriptional regulator [candidate division KSB1 bacterium]|nr:PadR family transcriptional regulator [candidate division KSB1 bacterium]MBL7093080.1 PadR family transcriptional regulator [candidate division KSB1 bacterium]